jgi:pimeloyl-ACP methyl ester carboxylesterase
MVPRTALCPSNPSALRQPVLFINGTWDAICDITRSRLGEPMSHACENLTVAHLPAGHWLPLEKKSETIQVVRSWIEAKVLV